jgi:hypothetical protein
LAAPAVVHFDQDVYVVTGPGDVINAQILIDGNPQSPRDDSVPFGLFSFGTQVTFNPVKALVTGPGDISAVPSLDFFGFAPGAFEQVSPGFAGVKGNIDMFENPLVPYSSSLLAELTLTNLASAVDSYPLTLDFFRTVGPNEQLFLNGMGGTLDPDITFRSARVVVIPEPATLEMLVAASVCGWIWLRRRKGARRAPRLGDSSRIGVQQDVVVTLESSRE